MKVKTDQLKKITKDILCAAGVPAEHADIIVDTIIFSHMRGKPTHGVTRMPIYVKQIENGLMSADTPITVVNDYNAIFHIDAHYGFGQVAAYYGMQEAIKRAEKFGISYVAIKDSNNFGVAGYFAKMAADAGMVGVVMGNSGPAIAPAPGGKALLGTNPISVAMPSDNPENPLVFDMATSQAARGKIRLAQKNGESIPEGWALDEAGNPTTDPAAALKGTMVPIGGYKGVGISLVIDLIAGMLSGAAFGGEVKPLNNDEGHSRYGNAIIVIDIKRLMDKETYEANMRHIYDIVHENNGRIPGESSYKQTLECGDEINVADKQIGELNKLAEKFGLEQRL